jgi:hypothetical protein
MNYDPNKPDLIIHSNFYKVFMLHYGDTIIKHFNVLQPENLTIRKGTLSNKVLKDIYKETTSFTPFLLKDDGYTVLHDVRLKPKYKDSLMKRSGINPLYTSYWFDCESLPIYKIDEKGPRYIIWTKMDPLIICATCVDRIDYADIFESYKRLTDWLNLHNIKEHKSVIVFDLDETLIDNQNNKLKCANTFLRHARNIYDLVVLYSHGSNLHVDDNVSKFKNYQDVFDLILSNNTIEEPSNKNLLYLYNHFHNVRFTYATLVDDSLYNWTPEYDRFIVPYKLTTLKYGSSLLYY